jgi:proteasome lid subunit RPN8/RPN11
MRRTKNVHLGAGVFCSLLTSCVEVYPKETIGLLGGYQTSRRNVLIMAYPMQQAKRSKYSVEIMNRKVQDRTLRIFNSLGIEFYGFYHSHIDAGARPSQTDLLSTVEEILRLKKKTSMLELIMNIKRKKYKRKQQPDFQIKDHLESTGTFEGYLITPFYRYDFKYAAEWVEAAPIDYEMAANRYKANLMLIESEVNKYW